jgi:hypothetical protein
MSAMWDYRDPLEPALAAQVSEKTLMEHVRTIGALERESGSPARRRLTTTSSGRSSRTASRSSAVRSRRTSACRWRRASPARRRAIEGLTHSFSTSVRGLEAELVDVGDGRPRTRRRAAGKIALVAGSPRPGARWAAQQAGTLGQIFVLMDHLHNMIVTTIWGTPSPETASRIPATPCLSMLGADGERCAALLARAAPRADDHARADGLDADPASGRRAGGRQDDRFVLFSGHVDSWHYGAMDNGTANATMLEVARLLAGRRDALRARHPLRVLVGALARTLRRLGLVRGPRLARAAPALRRAPQRRLDRRPAPPTTLSCTRRRTRPPSPSTSSPT